MTSEVPIGGSEGEHIFILTRCSHCGKLNNNQKEQAQCRHCLAPLSGPSGVIEEFKDGTTRIIDFDKGFLSPEQESKYSFGMAVDSSKASKGITAWDILDQGPGALLRQNRNWLCLMCGPTGTGKSYSALRIAEMMDKKFTADKIAFTMQQTLDLIKSCGKREFIIFDEGQEFSARRSLGSDNVDFSNILAMVRFRQVNIIFTLPHMMMIDVNSRRLIHNYLHTIPIDRERGAKWKRNKTGVYWYNIKTSRIPLHGKDPDVQYSFPVINGLSTRTVWFTAPDPTLVEEYEKQKERNFNYFVANLERKMNRKGDMTPDQQERNVKSARRALDRQKQPEPGMPPAPGTSRVATDLTNIREIRLKPKSG